MSSVFKALCQTKIQIGYLDTQVFAHFQFNSPCCDNDNDSLSVFNGFSFSVAKKHHVKQFDSVLFFFSCLFAGDHAVTAELADSTLD